jgi:hypothetical protein
VIAVFYFLIKGINKLSGNQQEQLSKKVNSELSDIFNAEPKFYNYDQEHYELDKILSNIKSKLEHVFRSSVKPERSIIEGLDEEKRPFLAAIVKHIHHQSSGTGDYTYIYAVKGLDVLAKEHAGATFGLKQIEDWAVIFEHIRMEKFYSETKNNFSKLKSKIQTV